MKDVFPVWQQLLLLWNHLTKYRSGGYMKIFRKIITGLFAAVILLAAVFLAGRYGWKDAGLSTPSGGRHRGAHGGGTRRRHRKRALRRVCKDCPQRCRFRLPESQPLLKRVSRRRPVPCRKPVHGFPSRTTSPTACKSCPLWRRHTNCCWGTMPGNCWIPPDARTQTCSGTGNRWSLWRPS